MITENEPDGIVELPSPPPSLTIGQRLRLAREQHQYTQQQVAQQLRLKCVTVQYIEEALPPEALFDTFIRGYIRSYARLVHLADQDILPALSCQSAESIVASTRESLSRRHRARRSENRLIMYVTWLVVITVLGLTIGWWWQHHKVAQEELTVLTHRLTVQEMPSPPSPTPPVAVPATAPPAVEKVPERAVGVLPSAEPGTIKALLAAAETQSPRSSPGDLAAAVPSAVLTERSSATLSLHFTGECWLLISDASGKTLFNGLKQAGDQLRFQGQPPYQLTIGAPRCVSITYQQRPVDLSHYSAHDRAVRLTLAPE